MPDISSYVTQIHDEEDKPLFEEAVRCANADANRAAYVFIWIACAESLKRRFRKASGRDGAAGVIVGKIREKEAQQKAVDNLLLEKGKEYGFLSEEGHTLLNHVYEKRCIYGHPYETAPLSEQVIEAAAVAVKELLGHPIRLKHGFCNTLINSLFTEESYLDDLNEAVTTFAAQIIPRIDETVRDYLFEQCTKRVEVLADDPSLRLFAQRGVWFCQALLTCTGTAILTASEWHERVLQYPKTLLSVLSHRKLFEGIGERARATIVGKALETAKARPRNLKLLQHLEEQSALNERESKRLKDHLLTLSEGVAGAKLLRAARLKTKNCLAPIIKGLKSHDYYVQNPIVELVVLNGVDGVAEVPTADLVELGRNILQAAEGGAGKAVAFTKSVDLHEWPQSFIQGLLLECFTNEAGRIRFKTECLKQIMASVGKLNKPDCRRLADLVADAVRHGTPKHKRLNADDFRYVEAIVRKFEWADGIEMELSSKRTSLFGVEADTEGEED